MDKAEGRRGVFKRDALKVSIFSTHKPHVSSLTAKLMTNALMNAFDRLHIFW